MIKRLVVITSFIIVIIIGVFAYSVYKTVLYMEDKLQFNKNLPNTTNLDLILPEFKLYDVNKKDTLIIDLKNTDSLDVILWATWCKPCLKEIDSIHKAKKENSYLFVSYENPAVIEKFCWKNNYTTQFYFSDSATLPFKQKIPYLYPSTLKITKDSVFLINKNS